VCDFGAFVALPFTETSGFTHVLQPQSTAMPLLLPGGTHFELTRIIRSVL
jgi:hypothetical protein